MTTIGMADQTAADQMNAIEDLIGQTVLIQADVMTQ
jgi:hypothetical protein